VRPSKSGAGRRPLRGKQIRNYSIRELIRIKRGRGKDAKMARTFSKESRGHPELAPPGLNLCVGSGRDGTLDTEISETKEGRKQVAPETGFKEKEEREPPRT